MGHRAGHLAEALTLADWHALNPSRPITDPPLGGTTDAKRSHDAFLSSLHDTNAAGMPTIDAEARRSAVERRRGAGRVQAPPEPEKGTERP